LNGKNPKDCEAHYYSFFYKSPEDPLPAMDQDLILKQRYSQQGKPLVD